MSASPPSSLPGSRARRASVALSRGSLAASSFYSFCFSRTKVLQNPKECTFYQTLLVSFLKYVYDADL